MSDKSTTKQTLALCSFCGGFKRVTFWHRKSEVHQKNVSRKLKSIASHICKKKAMALKVHDSDWPSKDEKRFCHFCCDCYLEHHITADLAIESLGAVYHHNSAQHAEAVKRFLKENDRMESFEKYCYSSEELERFMESVSIAKKRYLKKMDILNEMNVKQIRERENKQKEIFEEGKLSSSSTMASTCPDAVSVLQKTAKSLVCFKAKAKPEVKVPPWLIEEKSIQLSCVSSDKASMASSSFSFSKREILSSEVPIEPSIDTVLKHVYQLQKKGLPSKRIKANLKNLAGKSFKWRPVFHGVWNKGRHRKMKVG